jgi:hypothetical protein
MFRCCTLHVLCTVMPGNAIIPREKHESVTSDSTEGGEDGLTTIAEAEELGTEDTMIYILWY